jgi:hypothetical protein
MNEGALEKRFWRYWLGGLLLLGIMVVMNAWLSNDVSPWGIRDHQSAGSASRIDAIQVAWQAAGVMNFARLSIFIDLIYIAIYSYGAYCGGRLFAASGAGASKAIGWTVVAAAIVLGIADYIETIGQFIQAIRFAGNDRLAQIAAIAQPVKSTAFLTTFFGIILCLLRRRFFK